MRRRPACQVRGQSSADPVRCPAAASAQNRALGEPPRNSAASRRTAGVGRTRRRRRQLRPADRRLCPFEIADFGKLDELHRRRSLCEKTAHATRRFVGISGAVWYTPHRGGVSVDAARPRDRGSRPVGRMPVMFVGPMFVAQPRQRAGKEIAQQPERAQESVGRTDRHRTFPWALMQLSCNNAKLPASGGRCNPNVVHYEKNRHRDGPRLDQNDRNRRHSVTWIILFPYSHIGRTPS